MNSDSIAKDLCHDLEIAQHIFDYATVYHSTANRRELLEILHGWVNKRLEDNIEVARLIDYLNGGNEDDLHVNQ